VSAIQTIGNKIPAISSGLWAWSSVMMCNLVFEGF